MARRSYFSQYCTYVTYEDVSNGNEIQTTTATALMKVMDNLKDRMTIVDSYVHFVTARQSVGYHLLLVFSYIRTVAHAVD